MRHSKSTRSLSFHFLPLFFLLAAIDTAHAQRLSGRDLIAQLRMGGYVILMRHASSPRTPPDPAQSDAANVQHERQLDDPGRSTAQVMGDALRKLRIPVGEVLSSPTYRAGTNTIIVTHFPNVNEAFAADAAGLADGEALIFHPDGRGGAVVIGRIRIEEWPRLAAQ
jgi:hypothetical protein